MIRTGFAAMALVALASTAQAQTSKPVKAMLMDTSGKAIGTATIRQTSHSLQLRIKAKGLEPGEKGLHIHAVGKCEAPKFVSAGPHWNPDGKQHGRDNPMGSHAGDMPNLVVNAKGRGSLTFDLHGAKMVGEGGLMDADGSALVIHAKADDYKTDPTGNSGDRIVCGVFK
jgi:superoxide dismutase, Cu-Zn family